MKPIRVKVTRTSNTYKKPASLTLNPGEVVDHPHIPVGTEYIGYIERMPDIGETINVGSVETKNGEPVGPSFYFWSTPVINVVNGNEYVTKNSTYKIEILKD